MCKAFILVKLKKINDLRAIFPVGDNKKLVSVRIGTLQNNILRDESIIKSLKFI